MSNVLQGLGVDVAALEGLPAAERELVVEELRLVEGEFKKNPLLGYRPHAGQVGFHSPPFPHLRALFGGNRSGKTHAVVVDSLLQAVDGELVPEHLRAYRRWEPPFFCRFVLPDLTQHLEGVVLQKCREWCPRSQLQGGSFDRAWDKVQRVLRFKNGSWFQFFSNDQDLDKFGGAALHRIVYDEEPREDIRRECLMRLIDFGGEELFAMTPLHGMSWIYDEVFEPWERGELDGGRVCVVDMDDNPYLDRVTMTRILAGLSEEEREARKSGRFIHFAGLVFPQFSKARHVVPTTDGVPAGVEVFCGIDPGVRHMAAVVYCWLDHDDRMVVFDEIGLRGATVRQVCEEIHRRNEKWDVVPRWYVIDPAARTKSHQTGRSDQTEFADNGVVTIPGQNSVSAGINRIKERLDADRLQVMAHCQLLRDELKRYRWVSESNRSEDASRERPVKKDDHCFVAGTLVTTDRGQVPIERVRLGEQVLTRGGLCTVVASAPTRRVPVRTLTFEDGRELTGSEDHPCVVQRDGRQFTCRLDAVRYGDTMLLCHGQRSSSSRASRSAVTLMRARGQIASISARISLTASEAWEIFTSRFGRQRTVPFPPAGMFIMSTATPLTTTLATSNVLPPGSTSNFTWTLSAESRRERTWNRFSRSRKPGTRRRKDSHGTPRTAAELGTTGSPSPAYATSAATGSIPSPGATATAFAPTTASRRGGAHRGSMTNGEIARFAGKRFESTSIPGSTVAPVRVVANRAAGNSQVHNLTVYGHTEYFANGILVLNCLDALRYVCMQRPLVPAEDRRLPSLTFKDRLLRHNLKQLSRLKTPSHDSGPGVFL